MRRHAISRNMAGQLLLVGALMTAWALARDVFALDVGDSADDTKAVDVYVNDSLEAGDAVRRAETLTTRGRWQEAAELLQKTADEMGDRLIGVSPGYFVGVREHINRVVAAWPPVGIKAYRDLYDRQMQRALDVLTPFQARSVDTLMPLFDRYFCTTQAGELVDAIAQLAIESGDLLLAERVYREVLAIHPDRKHFAERYGCMLTLLGAMQGRAGTAFPREVCDASVRWMGQDRRVDEIRHEIHAAFSALNAAASPTEWPIFGGNVERNRRAPTHIDELGLLWRFDAFGGDHSRNEAGETDSPGEVERSRARRLTMHPVLSGDLVFVQRFREVVALHRNTGAVAWRYRGEQAQPPAFADVDDRPPGWDAVTVHDGRVYASLPGESAPYYSYDANRHLPELICFEAATGHVLWRVNDNVLEEAFAEMVFDSSPIVSGNKLLVIVRRRRSFGFEDCYLYRFHAVTGAFEHRTHLGGSATGTFGSRRATKTVAAMHGDTVYVCTNLGTIAAVSAHTGAVRWLRQYEHKQKKNGAGFSALVRDVKPWQFNPVVFDRDRMAALPTDAAHLLILSASNGKTINAIPLNRLGDAEVLLGLRGRMLCTAGREVACYDVTADSLRWSTALPEGATIFGRGVWTHERLLIPTRATLFVLDAATGRIVEMPWEAEGEGGNVLATGDQIFVAGPGRLSAYVRKADIFSALRSTMAASPTDPLPALELAEIALSNGELEDAIAALDEAVARADGQREPLEPALRRRLFDDTLMFVERLAARDRLTSQTLEKLFGYAARFPPDTAAHLDYRLRFAQWFAAQDVPERSVQLYQQILRDASLRPLPVEPSAPSSRSAESLAQTRIDDLIAAHGRNIYAAFDQEAARILDHARRTDNANALQQIVIIFPNSQAAPLALTAHGDLLLRGGRAAQAARRYAQAYHRYPIQPDHPALLRKIADAYERADRRQLAYLWLTNAARKHPTYRIKHQGRLTTFRAYRERLKDVAGLVAPSRPQMTLPLNEQFAKSFEEGVSLLSPRFRHAPAQNWSAFFVRTPQGVDAFDARTGTALWPEPVKSRTRTELLVTTRKLAVFANQYLVFAVDMATGQRRWSHGEYPNHLDRVDGDWEDGTVLRTHTLHGRRLVSLRDNGELTAVDVDTGVLLWAKTHRPKPIGRIALGDNLLAYHAAGQRNTDHAVVCVVDAAAGDWLGAVLTEEKHAVEGLYITLDERLLLATTRSVSCYDPQTQRRHWRIQLDGRLRPDSLLLDLDALYYSDDGRTVKKIGIESGKTLWESQPLARRGDDDLNLQLQDAALIVSTNASVNAVDTLTGLTLWAGTTPQRVKLQARLLTSAYLVAVNIPGGLLDAEATAYFYDHRNASGLIARDGGALPLGALEGVKQILAADNALLIQTGSTIRGWSRR